MRKNREKITFTCKECGKERTVSRESYPEDEVCSYCKSKKPTSFPEGTKVCNRCGEEKPYTEFTRRKSNSDGFENECKECKRKRKKEWYEERKKEGISFSREKVTFVCKECGKERVINKENYPEDEVCSYCRRKVTMKETYGYETNLMGAKGLESLDLSSGKRECSKCGEEKSLDEFAKNSTKKGGVDSLCLDCNAKKTKKYYEKYPDKKLESDKKYHENHEEEIKERSKKKYWETREIRLEKARDYYQDNKEVIKEKVKNYRQTERGRMVRNASNAKRRAGEKDTDITSDFIQALKEETTHCELCGNEIDSYHLDHIIPLAIDGPHITSNVRYICSSCNLKRPRDGRDILYYFDLDPSYSYEERKKEFLNTINREHDYSTKPFSNRIILSHQPHFYEVEKEMWKDWEVRKKLYINRMKYISRRPESLNDREILRGFKISGFHYGFSHFSPFWIKSFIRDFGVNSIYDPCGGWGHRLLGAWNIDYYYNDYDSRTYEGVINIYKEFEEYNKTEKRFFNEDASDFSPDVNYEAVFTCPPYFTKEEYLSEGTSTDKYPGYYDWINIWWRKVIKNTNPSKYFAFVIEDDLEDDMSKVVIEEGYNFIDKKLLGKSKSHFTRGKNEVLLIFDKK